MTTFESTLSQFCKELLDQLEGRSEVTFLRRSRAICTSFEIYLKDHTLPKSYIYDLEEYFRGKYQSLITPFNRDMAEFVQELHDSSIYNNPKRLAFIKEWASKAA